VTEELYKLDDPLLKKLATGSGRNYPHEGRAMAREILELRRKVAEAEAAKKASGSNGQQHFYPGIPFP
jgi:hypothetical protein